MEVQRELSAKSREALAHYRRRNPGGERARDNWTAIEDKLAAGAVVDEGDVDDDLEDGAYDEGDFEDLEDLDGTPANGRRSSPGRVLGAVGMSVAIAAAVLLLMRGVFIGATALSEDARTIPTQAVDAESQGDEERTWEGRTPKPSSPAGRARTKEAAPVPVADTTPIAEQPVVPDPAPTTSPPPSPKLAPETKGEPAPALTLAEETEILGQARAALTAARYDEASTIARDYQHRFPKGAFVEELHAIHAIASCKQGVGGDPLAAFEARHPGSPLLPRVQSGCEVAQ